MKTSSSLQDTQPRTRLPQTAIFWPHSELSLQVYSHAKVVASQIYRLSTETDAQLAPSSPLLGTQETVLSSSRAHRCKPTVVQRSHKRERRLKPRSPRRNNVKLVGETCSCNSDFPKVIPGLCQTRPFSTQLAVAVPCCPLLQVHRKIKRDNHISLRLDKMTVQSSRW